MQYYCAPGGNVITIGATTIASSGTTGLLLSGVVVRHVGCGVYAHTRRSEHAGGRRWCGSASGQQCTHRMEPDLICFYANDYIELFIYVGSSGSCDDVYGHSLHVRNAAQPWQEEWHATPFS